MGIRSSFCRFGGNRPSESNLYRIASSIQGWPSGIPTDSEDTLNFAALSGVRPMIEEFPLARAADAFERMISGKAQFRAVLTMS
jgi:D-arabinose 1-dehydrogenase-like Zn-dependent alcohol dehydrogenase